MAATSFAIPTEVAKAPETSARLVSLDVFRGATIAAMILVNNPGNTASYWPLRHAKWNGWTPTDLIFPFFLFIVGVSLVLSFQSRLRRGDSTRSLMWHTVKRSLTIFALGLLLNGLPSFHLATWRIPGVLQRIALAYLAAAMITLYCKTYARALWIAALLGGYWLLMRYVPVPGYGVPGRDMPFLDPNANLAAYLDRKLMMGHLYEGTRDPEGLLSTLPAIATTLCGVLTGEWLGSKHSRIQKMAGMFAAGATATGCRGNLEHLVSHQQEPVDQFVCAVYGGMRAALPGDLLLDHGHTAASRLVDQTSSSSSAGTPLPHTY